MAKEIIKALRIPEVILMTGFFVIGGLFGIQSISLDAFLTLLGIVLMSFLIILSVYAFNSASGKKRDKHNPRLKSLIHITGKAFFLFAFVFFVLAIALSMLIDWRISVLCIIVYGLWVAYSHPFYGLKHKPYYGTILHFTAQVLHFNMCYLAFQPIDGYGVALSLYFAFAFAAGHLHHEIIDYPADKKSHTTTTAVKHGIKPVINTIKTICVINMIYVVMLFITHIIGFWFFLFMFLPVLLHFLIYLKNKRDFGNKAVQIRNRYRYFYLISFLTIFAIKFYRLL